MADLFCTRKDWLVNVPKLKDFDVMTIHPLDGLTWRMVVDALAAMKLLCEDGKPVWRIVHHGTKIFIQREVGHPLMKPARRHS